VVLSSLACVLIVTKSFPIVRTSAYAGTAVKKAASMKGIFNNLRLGDEL
jgi:hypothetical protein